MIDYERLRRLSRDKGTSWAYLSEKAGMSRYYLNSSRNRDAEIPVERLREIAEALGTTVEFLRGEDPVGEEELSKLLDMFRHRPECQLLFSALENASADEVNKVLKIIEIIRGND